MEDAPSLPVYVVMAYVGMAYIGMAYGGCPATVYLCSYGLCRYGMHGLWTMARHRLSKLEALADRQVVLVESSGGRKEFWP